MSKSKKTVNEKKPFLAILPVAIGLVLIFGITLGIWAFSGPKANPQISNPNDPFLRLGDYVITNEKLYYALRQSYSYDEIQRFIDTELLKDINVDKNSDDYQEFRNEIIYGVKKLEDLDSDKTPAEILEVFENNMTISGYFTEAEREAYIELQYRREKYARQKYDEEIEEKKKDGRPFDISKYQTYYDQNYQFVFATQFKHFFANNIGGKVFFDEFFFNFGEQFIARDFFFVGIIVEIKNIFLSEGFFNLKG
jgi:hypothetical protein